MSKKLYGKSILKTHEKFYLADASLKYCIMDFHTKSLTSSPKNIVYFEFKREGYKVYTDKNKTKEIDFISTHCNEHIYIQIYLRLPEESVQEIVNFLEIKNHYPKYTITLNEFAGRNVNSIKMMHLSDCVLKDSFNYGIASQQKKYKNHDTCLKQQLSWFFVFYFMYSSSQPSFLYLEHNKFESFILLHYYLRELAFTNI